MARPPTPIGDYGRINTREVTVTKADGTTMTRWEARTLFRMKDGTVKDVMRRGTSKSNATTRLKERLRVLAGEVRGDEVTPDTRIAKIAELWMQELDRAAGFGTLAHGTVRNYKSHLRNWILPGIGELQAREVRTRACDALIKRAHDKASYATAKGVRNALAGLCAFAVRNEAMDINPVKSVSRLVNDTPKEVVAMNLEQRVDLGRKLREFAAKHQRDSMDRSLGERGKVWLSLPDVYEAMLSTGVRLGELLAIVGDDVNTTDGTITVGYHIVRVTGQGLVRQKLRKGRKQGLVLKVPSWSVPMWRRRKLASGGGPVFPSWRGQWLDPSNTIHRVREAFDVCGFEWVTSHVFRKTVATIMDEADLPASAIADQLGNTAAVVERHYRAKRAVNEAGAQALEKAFEAG